MYISKQRKPPTMRSMVIIVATPTIMVDTQLRTVLLCQDSVSLKVVGSLFLAAGEVGFRFAKTVYVTRKARRILPKGQLPQSSIAIRSQNTTMREGAIAADTATSPRLQDVFRAYELVAFHSAETFADMSAEYIAMGCSYAILVLFGSHPKFKLNYHGATDSAHTSQAATIMIQIGIAIVVDFVASVLEIRRGVNFDRINEDSAYLSFYSAVVAVANIHISSGIYLNAN
ncbi:hypothetical protein ON010_g7489 [Phytophthora cinnamomi]|nr:hypothetical protein ON010_g7489 [Phytophthora cinnamomi]